MYLGRVICKRNIYIVILEYIILQYDMYTGVRDYGAERSSGNLLIQQFPLWLLYGRAPWP